MGLPPDSPVLLASEWPVPPESRWHFETVGMLTAAFNRLYSRLNLVAYRNKALDIGIVTIVQFFALLNAAVVVGLEDTMLQFVRMYRPTLPMALIGQVSERKCNNWNPPGPNDRGPQFLYLVQVRGPLPVCGAQGCP